MMTNKITRTLVAKDKQILMNKETDIEVDNIELYKQSVAKSFEKYGEVTVVKLMKGVLK